MNKKILITNLIVDLLFIIAIFLVPSLMGYSLLGLKISFLLVGSLGVVNLILIAFFEYNFKDYSIKRFTLYLHATYSVIAILGIYIVSYVTNYEDNKLIYALSIYSGMLISVIVFSILNIKIKNKPTKVSLKKPLNK